MSQAQFASLASLLNSILVLLMVLTGVVDLYLFRQVKNYPRPSLPSRAISWHKPNAMVPAVDEFIRKLVEYGRTHADFAPIMTKYGLKPPASTNAAPASAAPPPPPSPSSSCCASGPLPSAAGHNPDDLQPVPRLELALGKLRRGYRFAVVLHHHAAGQELLREQELFQRARHLGRHFLPVGDDKGRPAPRESRLREFQ